MPNQVAIYTGSFDPLHLGHESVIRRAAQLFTRVIVGVGERAEIWDTQAWARLSAEADDFFSDIEEALPGDGA